jgi:hypothetical protein
MYVLGYGEPTHLHPPVSAQFVKPLLILGYWIIVISPLPLGDISAMVATWAWGD